MSNYTIRLHLYTTEARRKSDGTLPLQILVYHNGKRKYFSTGYSFKDETEYNLVMNPKEAHGNTSAGELKKRSDRKKLKEKIDAKLTEAKDIADSMEVFSFEKFKQLYTKKKKNYGSTVDAVYQSIIDELKENNRVGTAVAYTSSITALKKFRSNTKKDGDFLFSEITSGWLNEFENNFLKDNKSTSTIGIHLRHLRAVFNTAINEGLAHQSSYPFYNEKTNKTGYQIPNAKVANKALDDTELKTLFTAVPETDEQQKALDFWKFSFISSGMNMKDILKLKYKNFSNDSFSFIREKTKLTSKKNQKELKVILQPLHREIIERYGRKEISKNTYVFDVLNSRMTPEEEHRAVNIFIRFVNQHLQKLAEKLGLPKISTYYARHSYASKLMRKNVNIEFIRQELGHTNIKTTQGYLDSIKDDEKKEISSGILDFLDEKK